jgi:drug/metabolite transporter (DMT)-like permease
VLAPTLGPVLTATSRVLIAGIALVAYFHAGWSQLFAGLVLLPLVTFAPPPGAVTAAVVANVLGLALLCSAIAYLLYYRLIADVGPTRAMTVTFLLPLFGMLWGALLLDETITWSMVAGCALIVGGALAVLRRAPR